MFDYYGKHRKWVFTSKKPLTTPVNGQDDYADAFFARKYP